MKYILILFIILNSMLYSNPIDNAYSWINQEYKDFRTYPRVSKAQSLVKENKKDEAIKLLQKALKIDTNNQNAINLLLQICIQEKNDTCIKKYSKKAKGVELGYFYKEQAEKEKEKENYTEAIRLSKKALNYSLKDDDAYFVKLLLFESYLKSKNFTQADKLIGRSDTTLYKIFKWSEISDNYNETEYAYSLAEELPNKPKYLKWKIALLLKSKQYKEASKQIEILNKVEPSQKNKKQLLHLYKLTNQNNRIIKNYQKKLTNGCDKYALEFLLDHYKKNLSKKRALLEKNYPYSCLTQNKKIQLSLELVQYLKKTNPKKARKIAKSLNGKIKREKDLINLYQSTGQTKKLLNIYKKQLNKGCNKYALLFLLDYYKNNKNIQKTILTKNYPYSCMSRIKQNQLSLELISLLDSTDIEKTKNILNHLDINTIDTNKYLYLSNLESSVGEYKKSIEYAKNYLNKYPDNSEAIKNIGYSYFKLNKKKFAIQYLLKASKLDPTDHELLKNIGYLAIDLDQYKIASHYWSQYIKEEQDTELQLKLASLYFEELNQHSKANQILKNYEKIQRNYSAKYYFLKAKLSFKKQNCKLSLNYYDKALKIEKNEYEEYAYIHLLEQCNEENKALNSMQSFFKKYPKNMQYKKELAYMYEKHKHYTKAINIQKEIKDTEPHNVDNYLSLAYNYKKLNQTDKAIDTFKMALDKSKNLYAQQKENIKHEITNLSKPFHFYFVQSTRLNSYSQAGYISSVNNASYSGFGNMQLSYQPTFLPKSTTLYANIIHDHKHIKKTFQPSVGIRYKPLKEKEVYLSAEQLIKVGKSTKNDTLLRASLGISSNENSPSHKELYLESAYLLNEKKSMLYGNYELGKSYKISKDIKVTPYITTGGAYTNTPLQGTKTKLDVGIGVSMDILSGETKYEIAKYRNKLKLEARQKYAGNSKDKQALHLQWEFFY